MDKVGDEARDMSHLRNVLISSRHLHRSQFGYGDSRQF